MSIAAGRNNQAPAPRPRFNTLIFLLHTALRQTASHRGRRKESRRLPILYQYRRDTVENVNTPIRVVGVTEGEKCVAAAGNILTLITWKSRQPSGVDTIERPREGEEEEEKSDE
jgi:hypothetical protein